MQNAIRRSGAGGSATISALAEPQRGAVVLRVESTGATGGSLTIVPRPQGGLIVTVEFPVTGLG